MLYYISFGGIMQKSANRYYKISFVVSCGFLALTLILVACGSTNGNTNSSNKATIKTPGGTSSTSVVADISTDVMTPLPQVSLGTQACPAAVSATSYWDPIVGTQSGVSAVGRVTCANLIGNATLQALILVGYQGTGNIVDIYVYNKITDPHPQQLFKLQNLYKGDARISSYNTILTAEVDENSSENKDAGGNNALHPDLFREFQWSAGAGTFVP